MASGIYKGGQGYYTRMGTAVGVGLMSLFGLYWLWGYAIQLQVGTINHTYIAAAVCIVVGAAITVLVYWYVFHKPSAGDFLIATEGEMKKVNWSSRREIVGSTTVVIVVGGILTLFTFLVDKCFLVLFTKIHVLELPS